MAVTEYLFSLKPRGSKRGIDRMRPLAAALGHPETAVPCIHVAGTNGKGSVAAMIEAVLRAAGWRVGLYTSPHLVHLGERIQVNRQPLSDEQLAAYSAQLTLLSDRLAQEQDPEDQPSFFELMTAMAFLEFKRASCDIAVVEVGLGGEFDATNIVQPEVSVITSIGLDHCEWLGPTIPEIARAKAGIIKKGVPIVMGRVPALAEEVIREKAVGHFAPVFSVREHFGESISEYPTTNLAGVYQRWNAATATLALRCLEARWRIEEPTIQRGLHSVRWLGRWQRTQVGGRTMILDASHNAEGASVLDANLAAFVAETSRAPIVIAGALGVERAGPLLATICRYAKEIILVVPDQPRASTHAELETAIPETYRGRVVRGTVSQYFPGGDVCTAGEPDDVIVVTGSIYLLGEVMTQLAVSSGNNQNGST